MNEDGLFISSSSGLKDAFGHFQLGGVASKLAQTVSNDLGISSRSVEFGSTQRAAAHLQSLTDVEEAIEVGKEAVKGVISGKNKVMVVMRRLNQEDYKIEFGFHDLKDCANVEKKIPSSMINKDGNGVTKAFIDYALPLIQGENKNIYKLGIQQFAKFK